MEFHGEQRLTFALAGTVPLPSPFPASGRLTIGVFPKPGDGEDASYTYQFFLKVTQRISDQEVETRIVRLEDLRAVRDYSAEGEGHDLEGWTLKTADDLWAEIAPIKAKLLELARTPHVEPELEFRRRAIIYVPTSAPVLMRYEVGTTAGECSSGPSLGPAAAPGCGRLSACPPCPPPCGCGGQRLFACPPCPPPCGCE